MFTARTPEGDDPLVQDDGRLQTLSVRRYLHSEPRGPSVAVTNNQGAVITEIVSTGLTTRCYAHDSDDESDDQLVWYGHQKL